MASYPRQIPAGGEGNISIKVNTSGYGGRTMKKTIEVYTNDPANARTALSISGTVLNFARMEPKYARLVGTAGTDIKKSITITREKAYPFKILRVLARNGKDIDFNVQEFSQADADGYILTIQNKKTIAGRYADTVILTTDSHIKPTIRVPVYGQILSAAPTTKPQPPPKSTSDS